MKIALFDVLSVYGKVLDVTVPFERDSISFLPDTKRTYPVKEKSPVTLRITNKGSQNGRKVLEVEGSCSLTVLVPCDRCLKETAVRLPLSFSESFYLDGSSPDSLGGLDESQESSFSGSFSDSFSDSDDGGMDAALSGTELDVDTLVLLEILVNWPSKVLCRADCKGLCPNCGKDLNEGPCGCEADNDSVDPRMAESLANIRKLIKKSSQTD